LWIVTQYGVRIRRLPVYDEQVTLRTWPGEAMHLLFPRYWQILDSRGEPVIEASSLWLLMDEKERKMAFPEKNGIEIPGVETGWEIPLPRRRKMESTDAGAAWEIVPSLVDLNGHLNNAKYMDIIQDILPFSLYEKTMREFMIEYVNEARLGQTLHVRYGQDAEKGTVWVLGESDKTVFRMYADY